MCVCVCMMYVIWLYHRLFEHVVSTNLTFNDAESSPCYKSTHSYVLKSPELGGIPLFRQTHIWSVDPRESLSELFGHAWKGDCISHGPLPRLIGLPFGHFALVFSGFCSKFSLGSVQSYWVETCWNNSVLSSRI